MFASPPLDICKLLHLEQIQQFLGHAKLETTQIYAESTTAMMKDSYQKALGR
jgi:site-specific recombinase XerD